jgi:DNA-binding response OmpR family regulator
MHLEGLATGLEAFVQLFLDVGVARGFDAYATLQPPRPPVIFVTAYDGAATRAAVSNAGGQVLLTKPFLGDVLIDAVRRSI